MLIAGIIDVRRLFQTLSKSRRVEDDNGRVTDSTKVGNQKVLSGKINF
jgi:hypothetical protein